MWDRLAGPQVNRLPESPAPSINGRYLSVAIRIWATKWPHETTIFLDKSIEPVRGPKTRLSNKAERNLEAGAGIEPANRFT